jgi:squalene cyclase
LEIVQNEVKHCTASKHPFVRGGWSYMPHLPQFPPDTDDLAAVLHVAARVGNDTLSAICDDALQVVFESAAREDGSVETWILDQSDVTPHGAAIRRYIEVIGGVGVHPEVVANLLSGVIEYAPDRFRDHVNKGGEYLLATQTSEGYWPSKWYWGEVYGTFRSLQVLRSIDEGRKAVEKAVAWIVNAHRPAGDQLGSDHADPLTTALVMLCLAPERKRGCCRNAYADGCDWLLAEQLEDGSWDACPFIKMETKSGVLSYGSRTVTTAYCVKALVSFWADTNLQGIHASKGCQ